MPSRWAAFDRIRYSGERYVKRASPLSDDTDGILRHLWQSELAVSELVTPGLALAVTEVLDRLAVPRTVVQCFVFASPNIQAYCGWLSETRCVIRFSSALVDLLTVEEFQFVAGHELGHFIFGHAQSGATSDTLEDLMLRRAQEVSVDRVGLLGCDSLQDALSAMMKLASGLSARHIRFDVTRFISQLQEAGPSIEHATSTHPSVLVRARALLWFSLLEPRRSTLEALDRQKIAKIDAAIARDLDRLNESPVVAHLAGLEEDAALWAVVHHIVSSGGFTRAQQDRFEAAFGGERLGKVIRFLSDAETHELSQAVAARMNQAVLRFQQASPRQAQEAEERIAALAARVMFS